MTIGAATRAGELPGADRLQHPVDDLQPVELVAVDDRRQPQPGPRAQPVDDDDGQGEVVAVGRRDTGTSSSVRCPGPTVVPPMTMGSLGARARARMSGQARVRAAGAVGVALLYPLDDTAGDVHTRGSLDALQARRAVHLQHQGPVLGPDEVDAAHVEAHGPGGPHRHRPLLGGEADLVGGAARCRLERNSPARSAAADGHHPVADHEGPDVGARASRMNSWTRMLASSWRKAEITDSAALRVSASTMPMPWVPSVSLTTTGGRHRRAGRRCPWWMGEAGHGQADAVAGQQLEGPQLVPGPADGLGLVGGEGAHHLELLTTAVP